MDSSAATAGTVHTRLFTRPETRAEDSYSRCTGHDDILGMGNNLQERLISEGTCWAAGSRPLSGPLAGPGLPLSSPDHLHWFDCYIVQYGGTSRSLSTAPVF